MEFEIGWIFIQVVWNGMHWPFAVPRLVKLWERSAPQFALSLVWTRLSVPAGTESYHENPPVHGWEERMKLSLAGNLNDASHLSTVSKNGPDEQTVHALLQLVLR